MRGSAYSLDLEATAYSYLERANATLVALAQKHAGSSSGSPRILDIGCGCGVNARALLNRLPSAEVTGIEPNPRAAELASEVCQHLHRGTTDTWLATSPDDVFDVVLLADVLEHIANPMSFLRALAGYPGVRNARWVISVPNYAVWYNRVRTLLGVFDYTWSGLYDRTHLRFYTRRSVQRLLTECGFEIVDDDCSPSIVQSAAPFLRSLFDREVSDGNHLALGESRAYSVYQKNIEPLESMACRLWPELLGFQIVTVARLPAVPRQ